MQFPNWEEEKKFLEMRKMAIGLDEAGRGPLAGPVVAAAVWFQSDFFNKGKFYQEDFISKELKLIRDSKTLSSCQREQAFRFLAENPSFYFGLGQASAEEIDRLNILNATFLAMRLAVDNLLEKTAGTEEARSFSPILLVDGNKKIPKIFYPQRIFTRGDAIIFSIAAASIVAKVTRDKIMKSYHQKYPHYGFARHKGYGTKEHYANLKRFGPCVLHRKSFRLE